MTAEVGVMNRLGVALAADSAVSIGRDADKIYTSADKLFALSHNAPVGIMVYGNADFVGIPWETIVKEYRRILGNQRFNRMEEYAANFLDFLQTNRSMFPRNAQDNQVVDLVRSLFMHIRDEITLTLSREAEVRDGLNEEELPPIIGGVIEQRLAAIKSHAVLPGFANPVRSKIRSRLRKRIEDASKEIFGNLPLLQGTRRQLISIAIEMLTRHYFGPLKAGIVVAGFGETEFMPCLLSYEVEGMVEDRLRSLLISSVYISSQNSACIMPFAQQEMVHSFLRGSDPVLEKHKRDSTDGLFKGALDGIFKAIEKADEEAAQQLRLVLQPVIQDLLQDLFKDWDNKITEYWSPIVEIVSSLPKDELASMAESLVNLTKFRRRITPERETVGGPIDVAVITKGDGFVWVKRKHYFDPSLNPRAIARYEKES